MAEQIQGWEIVARVTADTTAARAELERFRNDAEEAKRAVGGLASGGGGGGGGPRGGGRPRASVGGSPIPGGMVDELIRQGIIPPGGGGGGVPPAGGAGSFGGGGWRPPATGLMSAMKAQAEAAAQRNIAAPATGLMSAMKAQAEAAAQRPVAAPATGLMAAMKAQAEANAAAQQPTASAPATGLMMAMKAQAEAQVKRQAKQLEDAGTQFGARAAYVLRNAMSGGPWGIAGAAAGGLAGLAFGSPVFGALVGNTLGQEIGSLGGRHDRGVALGSPGMAYQRDIAERDREAAESATYRNTYRERTETERLGADFAASGGKTVFGELADSVDKFRNWADRLKTERMAAMEGIQIRPGASVGAAVSPLAGHFFKSADDVWRAIASQTIMHSGGGGSALAGAFGGAASPPQTIMGRLQEAADAAVNRFGDALMPPRNLTEWPMTPEEARNKGATMAANTPEREAALQAELARIRPFIDKRGPFRLPTVEEMILQPIGPRQAPAAIPSFGLPPGLSMADMMLMISKVD